MENLNALIGSVNNIFWSYLLIVVLIGCALWFSFKTRFVQFRMLGEMFRIPFEKKEQKSAISSFEAFAVSLASRVGTGNLAGVATAIVVGGPGAVFWMWVMAIMGSASAFIESTLAQLYKTKGKDSYIGGPAYYIEKGLKKSAYNNLRIRIQFCPEQHLVRGLYQGVQCRPDRHRRNSNRTHTGCHFWRDKAHRPCQRCYSAGNGIRVHSPCAFCHSNEHQPYTICH